MSSLENLLTTLSSEDRDRLVGLLQAIPTQAPTMALERMFSIFKLLFLIKFFNLAEFPASLIPESQQSVNVDESVSQDNNNILVPDWIIESGESSQKVYTFNPAGFDVRSYLESQLSEWYIEEVKTSSWTMFTFQVKKMVAKIKSELESFYSTDAKPKPTRKITSTERHYISACIAKEYPLLVSQYQVFKDQHQKGEDLGCTVYASTFKTDNFMVMYTLNMNWF